MASFSASASSSTIEFQASNMDKERGVDVSNRDNNSWDVHPRADDTKSQYVDEICMIKNMACNRDV
ncbi:hypothetical protein PVK06_001556 [Gossypium arboreum]|uniref:Uncharacterized protein n=1 Tax=Gossypium arboreum TaxID=29729 RepID=A0ABR0R1B3_GOSAR|nr:hypothetical protein PVK06_001556 [Gossypium arboreum]